MIALAVAGFSVFMYLRNEETKKEVTDELEPETKKLPNTQKKLSEFQRRVAEIIAACPYADAPLKLDYLTGGKTTIDVVKAEMVRLGEKNGGKLIDGQ